MAVLHLVDSLAAGGAQTSLQAMMESPGTKDFHLAVLREVPQSITIKSDRIYVCRSPSRFSLRPLFLIRRLILAQQIRILHCHLLRSQVFGLFLQKFLFRHVRIVFQEHGQILGSNENRPIENALYRAFIRLSARGVDYFLANSQTALDALAASGPVIRQKSELVLAPIRELMGSTRAETAPKLRSLLGIRSSTFVVGFAGRIITAKGWRDLIEAVKRLVPQRDIFLLIAGDGPDSPQLLEALGEHSFAGRHHWLGFQHDMESFFEALDCIVVPSHRESQGLVQIEAQSLGIPVVAANVPGMRETLAHERDALLFEAHNAGELAARIDRLIEDPSLRERLVAGGKLNAARFTADKFVAALKSVYEKIGVLVP